MVTEGDSYKRRVQVKLKNKGEGIVRHIKVKQSELRDTENV